jgi:DNA-binding IclR family transcriptional regulator
MKKRSANTQAPKPVKVSRQAGIQSIEIGMRVIEALAKAPGPMALKELCHATRMAPSKLHRYLVSFVRTGMLTQYQASGRYDLGEAPRRLGLVALGRLDEFAVTSDHLLKLRDATGFTVMLSVWGPDGPRIVRWESGHFPLMISVRVGSTAPLANTASGLVFLAYLPDTLTGPILERQRKHAKPNEPGLAITRADLDRVRVQRSVLTESALIRGIDALAAPVFNGQGGLSSVITLLGSHEDFQEIGVAKPQAALEATASAISRALGAIAKSPFGLSR